EERIALGAALVAAMGREGRPEQDPVALQEVAIRPRPEVQLEPGRSLDVAEQAGDDADVRIPGVGHGQCRSASVSPRNRPASPRMTARATFGSSVTIASKSQLARARQVVGSAATTCAFRGWPSRTDSSPKNSPGPRVAI